MCCLALGLIVVKSVMLEVLKIHMFLANGVYVFSVLVCHSQKTPLDCYLSMLDVQMGNAKNKRCIVKRNKEELRKGKQQDLIGKKQ